MHRLSAAHTVIAIPSLKECAIPSAKQCHGSLVLLEIFASYMSAAQQLMSSCITTGMTGHRDAFMPQIALQLLTLILMVVFLRCLIPLAVQEFRM